LQRHRPEEIRSAGYACVQYLLSKCGISRQDALIVSLIHKLPYDCFMECGAHDSMITGHMSSMLSKKEGTNTNIVFLRLYKTGILHQNTAFISRSAVMLANTVTMLTPTCRVAKQAGNMVNVTFDDTSFLQVLVLDKFETS
jgi:hypothetical protein